METASLPAVEPKGGGFLLHGCFANTPAGMLCGCELRGPGAQSALSCPINFYSGPSSLLVALNQGTLLLADCP
jgi:hypothetical protein